MLFGQVVAGEFAESEQTGVLRDGCETHTNAELLEEFVIGVRERVGKVHVLVAAANLEHSVAGNDVLFQSGECNGRLDGGAGDVARAKSNLLIYDCENAAGIGIHGHDGAIVTAQAFDSGGTN